jgi:hypothetical protein
LDLRLSGAGAERNIYGSATLDLAVYLIENIFLSMATKNCQAGSGSGCILNSSVADPIPGCLSRISRILFFIHPGSRVPDPTTAPKRGGGIKLLCPTIFCSHKYHKIVNNLFLNKKRIFFVKTLRIIGLFTQKFFIKLSKLWVWDSGSRVKKATDPGSGSTTLLNSH